MLFLQTVEPHTLSVIQTLQSKNFLADFLLVGGTALALQLGHRTSTDIDLFTTKRFSPNELLIQLQEHFSLRINNQMIHALLIEIENVKSDFVYQPSTIIGALVVEQNVRMASLKDIAAMKISAITARGRKRDFIDLYILLQHFTLPEVIDFFLLKYPNATTILAIRSLFYFEDADQDFDPKCFFEYSWDKIKASIIKQASKL